MTEPSLSADHAEQTRETIFVLMNQAGHFLCARPLQWHAKLWSPQIGLAMRGDDESHFCHRFAMEMDKREARGQRLKLGATQLCRADIWMGTDKAAAGLADYVQLAAADTLCFMGFSSIGRPAMRLSKAKGFPAEARPNHPSVRRHIRLTPFLDFNNG